MPNEFGRKLWKIHFFVLSAFPASRNFYSTIASVPKAPVKIIPKDDGSWYCPDCGQHNEKSRRVCKGCGRDFFNDFPLLFVPFCSNRDKSGTMALEGFYLS